MQMHEMMPLLLDDYTSRIEGITLTSRVNGMTLTDLNF